MTPAAAPALFTVDHWLWYASHLVLDTGERWDVEDFQVTMFEPFLLPWRCKEIWTVIPEGNTKCLALSTRLPTPEGWTTMLDVQPGDELLGSDGLPVVVRRVSEVKFDKPCYRVTFSDGATLVCSDDHLWAVEDGQDHYRSKLRSTGELHRSRLTLEKRGKDGWSEVARWRVRTAVRRSSPDVDLPIHPYVLGVWLGDGHTNSGRITNVDEAVWEGIRDAGYEIGSQQLTTRAYTQTVLGLATQLRAAGLLGDKHIPAQYLIADEEDRWLLLQGLMDSDGGVSQAGQTTYSSTSGRLAAGVRQLVWSLGLPCSLVQSWARLQGVDYGPTYLLTISCDQRHPVVRLPRKRDRLKRRGLTCNHRRITAIERVRNVPVKCVEVDAPDRLYLAGEAYVPTHNTTSMAGFGLYHCHFTRSPWVPIVASSRDQAEILAQQAYGIIRSTPGLEYNPRTHTGYFRIFEGYRQIKNMRLGGRGIKVYAADVATSDGGIPTLVLCDEGHRWPDLGPYRLWKGKLGKRQGQIGMTSTAGDPGGDFEEQRDKIRDAAAKRTVNGSFARYESPNICLTEWMVTHPEKVTDMEAVKEANPFSGITVDSLREEFESPTTDLGDWKRLKCNIPARTVQAAITEVEWVKAYIDWAIPEGAHVDLGIDVAWKHDTFALVPLWGYRPPTEEERDEMEDQHFELMPTNPFRLLGPAVILTPPRDGSTLPTDDVKLALEELMALYTIDTAVMDTTDAEDTASWLRDECSIEVVDRPQGNSYAVEDYAAFMKGLRTGMLKHNGDPGLRKHAMNAIARKLPGDKTRFDRPSQSRARRKQEVRVIDALTAAAMVNQYVDALMPEEDPFLVAWR